MKVYFLFCYALAVLLGLVPLAVYLASINQ